MADDYVRHLMYADDLQKPLSHVCGDFTMSAENGPGGDEITEGRTAKRDVHLSASLSEIHL